MKKLFALCSAVVLFALMGSTTAAAQVSGPDAYAPSIPQHEGLNDDGSVSLDFSGTGFVLGQTIVVTVMGQSIPILIGADGTGTYPASAPSLAGKSVLFTGQVVEDPNGPPRTSAGKSFPAAVEPTPVPTAVVEPTAIPTAVVEPTPVPTAVVEPTPAPTAAVETARATVVQIVTIDTPDIGDPATARVTAKITTPRNLPAAPVASPAVPLALTGAETSVPLMIGSGLVLVGGLAILASRRRTEDI